MMMGAEGLEWPMPEVSSSSHPLDVIHHCGLSNPSLALTPLTQRVIAKDRFSETLPGSSLVPGISWRCPALMGWALGLPGTLWLVADDRRHLGPKLQRSHSYDQHILLTFLAQDESGCMAECKQKEEPLEGSSLVYLGRTCTHACTHV
jgi:hypothetical protein